MSDQTLFWIYLAAIGLAVPVGLFLQAMILTEIYRVRRVRRLAARFPRWWVAKRTGILRRVHLVDADGGPDA